MSDIWSNLGADVAAPQSKGWLYRHKEQLRGPVPEDVLVQKLIRGEIDLKTPVAREGGDFYPAGQVAAFAPHLADIKKHARKRAAAARRKVLLILALPVLAGLAVGGYFLKQALDRQAENQARIAEKRAQERAAKQAEIARILQAEKPKPVALVSLGDIKDFKVGGSGKRRARARTTAGGDSLKTPSFSSCQRSQQEIFGVLQRHLTKINVCVQDEKQRDKRGLLPPTLNLDFVVNPTGRVSDFVISDRHYRRGPMNNCMIKAFKTIRFPAAGGSNCPVTIPIRIGG